MKIFKRKEAKRKNNKGFSLVELIVVIAIMAVLVAVLAPQFTKYVDRSRKSNDATMVTSVVSAVQTGIVDTSYKIPAAKYKLTFGHGGAALVIAQDPAGGSVTEITKSVTDVCGELSDLKLTAKGWTEDVAVTVDYSDGQHVKVDYSDEFEDYVQ